MSDPLEDKGRRHQLLIARKFQSHYITIGVVTALVTVNIGIAITLLIMGGPLAVGFTVTHGAIIGVVELILVAGLSWLGLKTSHSIAGPVYVLERELARIEEGDLTVTMTLRKGDEFQDLAETFNAMCGSLRGRVQAIKSAADRLASHRDQSPELDAAIRELEESLAGFRLTESTASTVAGDD